jgi:hypothetical protein
VNAPIPIMFAHGEQVILPALLLIVALVLVVYPGAIWVLLASRDRTHRRFVIASGVVLALVYGAAAIATLRDFSWPPELGDCIGFLIWAVPAACGVVALVKVAASVKHERDPSN